MALLLRPVAVAAAPLALLFAPVAVAASPLALLPAPVAVASSPLAMALVPVAVAARHWRWLRARRGGVETVGVARAPVAVA